METFLQKIKGIINLRDAGGYSTNNGLFIRRGYIFRSGYLDRIKNSELELLLSGGVKKIIDLRSSTEIKNSPSKLQPITINIPLDYDKAIQKELSPLIFSRNTEKQIIDLYTRFYLLIIDSIASQLREIFTVLSKPESYPVLIHCRAGKDRTGIVCAIIQLLLGMQKNDIIHDYMLSNTFFLPKIIKLTKILNYITFFIYSGKNIITSLSAHESVISAVLDRISMHYRGIETYLLHCKIPLEQIRAVKEIILTNQ